MKCYSPCTRMFALVLIVFLSASPCLEARVERTHGFDMFSRDEEIFVNLGTIQTADNEAQLAGVLSHEISHVVQRHRTRAASKQMGVVRDGINLRT